MDIFDAINIIEQNLYDFPEIVKNALFTVKTYAHEHEHVELFHCTTCSLDFFNTGIHSANKLLAACPNCGKIIYIDI